MSFIEVRDLVIEFTKIDDSGNEVPGKKAVNGVSLDIEKGSFTAVVGMNGSGKSTLAKSLNGLLLPTAGSVIVDGFDTRDEAHIWDVRSRVGMVFQNPDNQIVATIVEDDVAFGPENLGVEPKEIRKRVDDALKAVNMYEFRNSEPYKLSGGQKQRVAIAGVIAMQTRCIVLDEPTAMLDPNGRKEVLATIKRLNRERGITVVLVTHFMDEAVEADRVVVIDNGEVYMDGTPREVFSKADELINVGLDVPQATQLAKALRAQGLPIRTDILDEEECIEAVLSLLKE